MRSNNKATSILYFAAGLSLGDGRGILVAPARGVDTRRYLTNRAEAAREYSISAGICTTKAESWPTKRPICTKKAGI